MNLELTFQRRCSSCGKFTEKESCNISKSQLLSCREYWRKESFSYKSIYRLGVHALKFEHVHIQRLGLIINVPKAGSRYRSIEQKQQKYKEKKMKRYVSVCVRDFDYSYVFIFTIKIVTLFLMEETRDFHQRTNSIVENAQT